MDTPLHIATTEIIAASLRLMSRVYDDSQPFLVAAGKKIGELEQELHSRYVPKYFRRLTVTILSDTRYFTVSGQVRKENIIPYRGELTLLEGIAAAGGFTDFAKKTKVQVTRANGDIFHVNCNDAQKNPQLDLPIYPGDQIFVPRRLW